MLQTNDIILKPVCRARGGIHPPHNKRAAEKATVELPLAQTVYIPMVQHIGAPCKPLVQKGDLVTVGQKIGENTDGLCAPIHSSVSGEVIDVKTMVAPNGKLAETVIITTDGLQTPYPDCKPHPVTNREELVAAARECGLVGLGGAGFPTYVKFNPKEPIDTLVINAAECEPHITSDYRTCMEDTALAIQAVITLLNALDIPRAIIGIEDNKPKAIDALAKEIQRVDDSRIKIMKLPSHYPHGAEKVLIQVTTGRRVHPGKLPSSVGCIVTNITSITMLQRFINTGMPLTGRRITLGGPAVKNPMNVIVPIGTPISHLIAYAECLDPPTKILMGGPMMGIAQLDEHHPVIKQNNAILLIDKKHDGTDRLQGPCIRCGRCASACPMSLMPTLIERFAKIDDVDSLRRVGVKVCMECGSCAYSCPANRPLVQYMRLAKEIEAKERK